MVGESTDYSGIPATLSKMQFAQLNNTRSDKEIAFLVYKIEIVSLLRFSETKNDDNVRVGRLGYECKGGK